MVKSIETKPKRTKKEIKIEIVNPGKKREFLEVDGKKYIFEREKIKKVDGIEHSVGLVYKKFNEKEYAETLQIIVNAIKNKTTKTELLTQLLKDIDNQLKTCFLKI